MQRERVVAKGWLWGSGSHTNIVVALIHWKGRLSIFMFERNLLFKLMEFSYFDEKSVAVLSRCNVSFSLYDVLLYIISNKETVPYL